jgi:hypothetical protein
MPYEIDYALLTYVQLKKTSYHLKKYSNEFEVEIDTVLNCSNYLIDWYESQIPKDFFIKKFTELKRHLKDYKVDMKIYEGDECYGIFDVQRESYCGADYYLNVGPDIYFTEDTIPLLLEGSKVIKNKYSVFTPEIHRMWDESWDVITNPKYLNIPYEDWCKTTDTFDIRFDVKTGTNDLFIQSINRHKWACWFDLYSGEFYENLAPVLDYWVGYGGWDYYSMLLSDYAKMRGADVQQYLLRGRTVFEYGIGSLNGVGFHSYYKEFIKIKNNKQNQRDDFHNNMNKYLKDGVDRLIRLGVIN